MELENVVTERKRGSIVSVGFDVPPSEVEASFGRALKKVASQAQLPGFRKGKAPVHVVERQYEDHIKEMAERLILDTMLHPVMEKAGIRGETLVSAPVLKSQGTFQKAEPFHIEMEFCVSPDLEPKNYTGLKLTRKKAEVSDAAVEKELSVLAEQHAAFVTVERPAAVGDGVIINCTGTGPDGKDRPELKLENHALALSGSNLPKPFEAAIAGMSAGEKKTFDMMFEMDHRTESLRGLAVTCHIELIAVKERRPPAIDDEFAKDLGVAGLDLLKQRIREGLANQAQQDSRRELESDLLEQLRIANPVEDLPQSLIEEEEYLRWMRVGRQLSSMGLNEEQAKKAVDEKRAELSQGISERSREVVHVKLILRAIARLEKISVTDEECLNFLAVMAQHQNQSPDVAIRKVIDEGRFPVVKNECMEQKTLHFLLEKADIQEG